MGILRLPGLVRTTQPQSGPLQAAPEWVAMGLASLTSFMQRETDVYGKPGTLRQGTGHQQVAASIGRGISQNNGANYWSANAGAAIGPGAAWAVCLTFSLNSVGQTNRFLVADTASGNQAAIIFGYVTNTLELYSSNNVGADPRPSSGIVISDTLPHTVIYSYDGTTFSGYIDGKQLFSTSLSFSLNNTTSSFFGSALSGSNVSDATFFQHARFTKGLSKGVAKILSANPWQLIRSTPRVMLVAAGGTDTPISPGVGALALAGYAPSVTQSANQSLAPGAGSINITGYAPTIAQPNTISPGVGSLAVTGYAPTVTQAANQEVTPGTGLLVLTGYAPAVTQTAGQWVVPEAGSLTISGFAPTITQPQTVVPGLGSLAITGYAPTVTQAINQSIVPDAGTLTLSGYAPSIAQSSNQLVQPAAGSLSLTGYAPLVAQSVNQFIAPSVGSLTITGFAPTVEQASASPNLQPGAGMLSIVGYAPTVEQRDPSASTGGGGAGDWRSVRDFADRLDKASRPPKPTKAAKKKRREQLEEVALELLPDLPAARLIAPVIAQAVYRKEAAAVARWTPPQAMQPVIKPNASAVEQAAELEAEALAAEFDASEAIRAMVEQWQKNEAIARELEREAEEESEIEMLLLG